ncbi:NAD(P)H:quinone oxidoreductase [Acidaminobacter hydrogenoformans]|uniref:NAD(P)H dehydrogenase (Quinone) n=1 Tax=Acidaminobacter hydrogenoformans DSM 2784 TaxID=1120920 RepID=A0A1G5S6X9_9FIRM|nr:NAD(P)H:quinone oxidoreductase [Acidaminobacter hydrogenoformans]SCZ82115.1 NAD(P)H dehydrogenase (quinone) [Acidaminobacter hydrogenoformans DSM 2784]
MSNVKLSIIYYSATGINYQLAQWAKEAAEAAGAEVRLVKARELAPEAAIDGNPAWRANVDATKHIPEATSEDLDWADAILFSVPTRFGNMASQMKQFIDTQGGLWAQGKLANKAVSAMSSAQNPHGGQEATILSLYTSMMHWGAIIVAPGYTDASIFKAGGNPYGTSVTQGQDGKPVEDVKDAVAHQTKRLIETAGWLKKGRA